MRPGWRRVISGSAVTVSTRNLRCGDSQPAVPGAQPCSFGARLAKSPIPATTQTPAPAPKESDTPQSRHIPATEGPSIWVTQVTPPSGHASRHKSHRHPSRVRSAAIRADSRAASLLEEPGQCGYRRTSDGAVEKANKVTEWSPTQLSHRGPVAQGIERPPPKRQVGGSNPPGVASDLLSY